MGYDWLHTGKFSCTFFPPLFFFLPTLSCGVQSNKQEESDSLDLACAGSNFILDSLHLDRTSYIALD